jgi:hypothetical protein
MNPVRWSAGCILSLALIAGCQPSHKAPETANTPMMATPEQTAAAKARYIAKGDMLVGEVDAAKEGFAAVSGIDPKLVTKDDRFSFIDVDTNSVINHGTLAEVGLSGRLVIRYSTGEQRAPRVGDLCVKPK